MDRFKGSLRVINTFALLIIAYANLAHPGFAAPSAGMLATPMGPGFEYEGRLGTLSGLYDFQFRLFNVATGGSPVLSTVASANNLMVDNGEYVTFLKFGESVTSLLTGQTLYLEVKYRVHTTNVNAPYTLQDGDRAQLLPTAYALSLRPGASVKGNLADPKGTINGTNTGTGPGVVGQSTNGYGVKGISTSSVGTYGESSNYDGVFGKSTTGVGTVGVSRDNSGVAGQSTNGSGVYGTSTNYVGVFGTSTSSTGVAGQSTSGAGTTGQSTSWYGVYGVSASGAGVVGSSSTGYALLAQGNASQSLAGGGFVKAMALIDPYNSADPVQQCFNGQLPGSQATSGNCGITASLGNGCGAERSINFGFNVYNRMVSVTPFANDKGSIGINLITPPNVNTVVVDTFYTLVQGGNDNDAASTCAKFFIVVY